LQSASFGRLRSLARAGDPKARQEVNLGLTH